MEVGFLICRPGQDLWAEPGDKCSGLSKERLSKERIERYMNTPKHPSIQEIGILSTEPGIMGQPSLDFPCLTLHLAGNVPAISFRLKVKK